MSIHHAHKKISYRSRLVLINNLNYNKFINNYIIDDYLTIKIHI